MRLRWERENLDMKHELMLAYAELVNKEAGNGEITMACFTRCKGRRFPLSLMQGPLHCLDLQLLHLWLVPLLVLARQALLHLPLLVRILDLHDPVLDDNLKILNSLPTLTCVRELYEKFRKFP